MMFSPEAVIHTEVSPSITQSVCLYGQRGVCTFVVGVMVKVVEVVGGGGGGRLPRLCSPLHL